VLLHPIVIVLATVVGAIVGTIVGISVGVLLLRRKLRPPVTDAEFAELKSKLQTGESALTAASVTLNDLRQQIGIQARALLQNSQDLKEKQEQLHASFAETQKEKDRRTTVEKTLQEQGAKTAFVSEQCTKLEARVREEEEFATKRAAHLASVESERDTGKQRIQELTEQLARLAFESEERKRSSEQETRFRTALEAQMKAEQERIGQLTTQVAELQGERLQLEIRLKEETGVAAKGMELLVAAQEKLSSVFKAIGADLGNGQHNLAPVGAAAPSLEVKTAVEKAETSSSSS
jgi:chromosome segregation ATPase